MSIEITKPQSVSSLSPTMPHAICPDFAQRYPATAAYWFGSSWPDGSVKRSATIRVAVYQGKLQATFSMIGTGLRLVVELLDPILLFDALEALLTTVPVPWAVDPFNGPDAPPAGGRKGKKK